MGNCTYRKAKPSKTYTSSVKISTPAISYLDYKSKTLTSFSSESSFSMSLKKKVHFYKDSSISLIDSNIYIIAGGTDSSNTLTNSVYLLSLSEKSLQQLPNLPIPSKYGVFLSSPQYFYYISGICEAKDNEATYSEEATPLCRLDKTTFRWEVFICESQFNPSKFLQRKIGIYENTDRISVYAPSGVKLKDLYEPGAVLLENKIYLIGGKLYQGEMRTTDKVFGVCLEEGKFLINEENFSLPICLSAPSCCIRKNIGCVTGGFLKDMSNNSQVFVIDFNIGVVRKVELNIDRPIDLRYPIFPDSKGVVFISYPKVVYLREDKQQVFVFGMPSAKEEVACKVLDKISNEQSTQKIKVNLRINFIIEEKIEKSLQENKPKFNPFDVQESPNEHLEKKDKNKRVYCSCGILISENVRINKTCDHCGLAKPKIYCCDNCSSCLCKSCAKWLETAKPFKNPNIKCHKNHYFCQISSQASDKKVMECVNCLKPAKIDLECFICKVGLCSDCESLIISLTSPIEIKCVKSHLFSWKTLQLTINPVLCDACLVQIKHIGLFFCKDCTFSLCIICVKTRKESSSKDLFFFKAYSYQEKPKRLSDNLYKPEFNNGDEPEFSAFQPPKNKFSSASFSKIESVCSIESSRKARFETDLNEIKKQIVPKPIRSAHPPFLSITPRRLTSAYTPSSFTPRIIELQQKTLGSSSESVKQELSNTGESRPTEKKEKKSGKNKKKYAEESKSVSKASDSDSRSSSFIQTPKDLEPRDLIKKISSKKSRQKINTSTSSEAIQNSSKPNKHKKIYSVDSDKNSENLRNSQILNSSSSNVFSAHDEESEDLVAPDIRGTIAESKLLELKAKLNLLTEREVYSSSESESFKGFVFQPEFSDSESLPGKKSSLSKKESKRYTLEDKSFSKESDKNQESWEEESFSSAFSGYQIQFE